MNLTSSILKAVARPRTMIFVPYKAAFISGGIGMAVGLFVGVLWGLFSFLTIHLTFMVWGFKNPHFVEVFLARSRSPKTQSLTPTQGHHYGA